MWKALHGVSDPDLLDLSYCCVCTECVDCFVATEENDNDVNLAWFVTANTMEYEDLLRTVDSLKKTAGYNTTAQENARPLACVKAKFTEMPDLHCVDQMEKSCAI